MDVSSVKEPETKPSPSFFSSDPVLISTHTRPFERLDKTSNK